MANEGKYFRSTPAALRHLEAMAQSADPNERIQGRINAEMIRALEVITEQEKDAGTDRPTFVYYMAAIGFHAIAAAILRMKNDQSGYGDLAAFLYEAASREISKCWHDYERKPRDKG